MKHIKLFEELNIPGKEYTKYGYELTTREKQILIDMVGKDFLDEFDIKKEDFYYYTSHNDTFYNQFEDFDKLRDYLLCRYYIQSEKPNKLLELIEVTDIDPSFDRNMLIRWSSEKGNTEIVKPLLQDPRVDPSDFNNYAIRMSSIYGHTEVVKLLLKDRRVIDSLTPEQIYKYIQVKYLRLIPND